MENNTQQTPPQGNINLLKSQGLTYTQKSKKLEDAKSSSYLFIVFGIIGLFLLLAFWMGLIPLSMALYMKILYTIILGALFIIFIIVGIHYTRKIKVLTEESSQEEQLSNEIITWVTTTYSLDTLDNMIEADSLPMEQLYFERYDKLSSLIQEKYQIQDEKYLDYLVEKVYQVYSPED